MFNLNNLEMRLYKKNNVSILPSVRRHQKIIEVARFVEYCKSPASHLIVLVVQM